jgi:hypothetical protein
VKPRRPGGQRLRRLLIGDKGTAQHGQAEDASPHLTIHLQD